jgi:selenocysteine lyase/cysteine desulfurase
VTDSNVGASAPSELAHAFVRLRNAEFPWTAEATYLNNASIGPLPERTRGVVDAFTAKRTAPYQLPDKELQGVLREARRTVARLLNADVEEIALATNTSFGLNIAATSLPIAPGETVLVSDKEFPANVYPWLLLRERGVDVELAPVSAEGWPSEGYLLERLRDPRVRVLAVSPTGTAPTWTGWARRAAPTAPTSWWTPSRRWGRSRWTCARHRWTCWRAARRSGCCRRGAPGSCTCGAS